MLAYVEFIRMPDIDIYHMVYPPLYYPNPRQTSCRSGFTELAPVPSASSKPEKDEKQAWNGLGHVCGLFILQSESELVNWY